MTLTSQPVSVITGSDLAAYQERGYWVSPKLLDDAQIAELRSAHEHIWRGDRDFDALAYEWPRQWDLGDERVRTFANGWWVNDAIRRLVTSPILAGIAARLLDVDEVCVWHDQVIWKPPQRDAGSVAGTIGWHQDRSYWHAVDSDNLCTAWVALQDTDLRNGGMRTLVGSHRAGEMALSGTGFFNQDMAGFNDILAAAQRNGWVDEPCVLQAGQASFHHALCLHASGANLSNEPRLSVAIHYMPRGCRWTGEPHSNVKGLGPLARRGDRFEGSWWPRVWPQ